MDNSPKEDKLDKNSVLKIKKHQNTISTFEELGFLFEPIRGTTYLKKATSEGLLEFKRTGNTIEFGIQENYKRIIFKLVSYDTDFPSIIPSIPIIYNFLKERKDRTLFLNRTIRLPDGVVIFSGETLSFSTQDGFLETDEMR